MAVTIPAVLIALDIYPLERINKTNWLKILVWEKIPFFLLSLPIIVITIVAQENVGAIHNFPILFRLINAINNTVFYLFHWLWPFKISAFYPFPEYIEQFSLITLFPILVFLFISVLCFIQFRAGRKYWLIVWVIYLITLSPVIGLVHSGPQAAADRYAHLTTIGFYILLASGIVRLWCLTEVRWRIAIIFVSLIIVFCLSWFSHQQTKVWQNDLTLWQSVINRYPRRSPIAHNNLGNAFFSANDYDHAKQQYSIAITIDPTYEKAYYNLFNVYQHNQQWSEALEAFELLKQQNANVALIQQIIGDIHASQGKLDIAETYYRQAVNTNPELASSNFRLAQLHLQKYHYEKAIKALQQAIITVPHYVDAMLALAEIYKTHGQISHALALFWHSYQISPYYKPVYEGLIGCLTDTGQVNKAKAIRMQVDRLRNINP